jgi:hypothetical protein
MNLFPGPLEVLVVGALEDDVPAADGRLRISRAGDLDDALALVTRGAIPPADLIVIAEPRGGLVGERALEALRRTLPLARFWRVRGSWREGVARGLERAPAGSLSSDAHEWPAPLARELETLRRGANPLWALPATATAEERILAAAWTFRPTRLATLLICAAGAQTAGALADLCRAAGYEARLDFRFSISDFGLEGENPKSKIQNPKSSPPACIVWDTAVEEISDPARVADLRARAGGAPVVAIVGFPRPDDAALARRHGIAAVIGKPFAAEDLFWHVERAIAT